VVGCGKGVKLKGNVKGQGQATGHVKVLDSRVLVSPHHVVARLWGLSRGRQNLCSIAVSLNACAFSPPSNMHGYLPLCSLNHNAQLQIYIHRMRIINTSREDKRGA
jgi:hypothetical protein